MEHEDRYDADLMRSVNVIESEARKRRELGCALVLIAAVLMFIIGMTATLLILGTEPAGSRAVIETETDDNGCVYDVIRYRSGDEIRLARDNEAAQANRCDPPQAGHFDR